jgi:hypothetical protein
VLVSLCRLDVLVVDLRRPYPFDPSFHDRTSARYCPRPLYYGARASARSSLSP